MVSGELAKCRSKADDLSDLLDGLAGALTRLHRSFGSYSVQLLLVARELEDTLSDRSDRREQVSC